MYKKTIFKKYFNVQQRYFSIQVDRGILIKMYKI